MGNEAFAQMKTSVPLEPDGAVVEYVRCIALPITRIAQDTTGVTRWEVVVFNERSANAFALPGGKIGIHTGMLQVRSGRPDQLASVIGHEVGHVIARHSNERVSQAGLAKIGLQVLGSATRDSEHHQLLMGALGLGAQYGLLMPHSRSQEREADVIGLQLMAKAGFDPNQSVELWKNMARASGPQPPEFLSTHPSHQSRIRQLEENISGVLKDFDAAKSSRNVPSCPLPSR